MRIKFVLSAAAISGLFCTTVVADNTRGIDCFRAGLPEAAKVLLLDHTANPQENRAEACFYLGEIYFSEQKNDSAAYFYQQGLSIDPEYQFNKVGEAKLLMKKDPETANHMIEELLRGKNKKNVELLTVVARAYEDNGLFDKAVEYVQRAKDENDKYAGIYVVEGDLEAAKKEYGNACTKYEQAVYFDPLCKEAYLKYARVYKKNNPKLSVEILERLLTQLPDFELAQREVAEVYYLNGQMSKAAVAYDAYMQNPNHLTADMARYATILFFNGDYTKSLDIVSQVQKEQPGNFVMKRLAVYNNYELKNYEAGLTASQEFMKTAAQTDLISMDYAYYGRLLSQSGNKKEAVMQFEKAIILDTTKIGLYKELASLQESLNDYDQAIAGYKIFIAKGDDQVKLNDYLLLGKCNYYGITALDASPANVERKTGYYQAADSLFAHVNEMRPDSYLGNFWRARVNSAMDAETEKGLAKPYYEAALGILEKEDPKEPRLMIECYSYLGYYYYVKADIPASKTYWAKILLLDPANEVALNAMKGMK